MSSDGIATALKDSASSLVAANNSYEEAVALIASANRVVQDPGSVGAALRTISLRLRGTSTKELEEAGEDTTGVVESKSKLRTKIQGYTGVDILTDTGAYKSTYEILLEISKVWDDLTDQDRAGLLELIAGKTRSNTAAAILSNGKDLEEALLAAQEAEGSALAENEKYLDSIQGKLDQFNNAVQTMWSNTLKDEWVKDIVEIGTFLVESVDNLGLIKTLLTAIGTIVIQKNFKGDLLGGLFGDTASIKSIQKQITDLEVTYNRAKARFQATPTDKNREAMENAGKNLNTFKEANQPIIDAEEQKNALNEQLEKLKLEREQLQGDLQTAQNNLTDITANGIQDDIGEFVDIDTSHIDDQIAGVQEKLNLARQQLAEMPQGKKGWEYYKSKGSVAPAKDRDERLGVKKNEIKELEAELGNLQTQKDEFMSSKIQNLVEDGATAEVKILTDKINETDDAIQQTEVELKKVEMQADATGNSGLIAGSKFKTGFNKAKASIKQFGKEMLKSMAWSMAIAAVFEMFGNIGDALAPIFKNMDKSAEALQDKFEELESELSAVESELRSLQSELKDTDERIEELMSQGSLTFVEQEELNKLKSVSAELKAQIGLQETLKKSKQQGVNSASIEATNAYLDTSFMSEQTRTEKQEKWSERGEAIGQVVGTVGGAVFGAKVLGAIGSIGGPLGTAIGIAAGSIIGGLIGTFAGESLAGAAYDSEQSVGEAMDSMLETRAKLKADQDKALAENDVEAYNEATEALRTYDTQMAKHISQIQQNYNAMDWEVADPETRKEMMEYADWLDKYNISMGTAGAKSNAIARIFGDEASEELKEIKKRMEEAAEAGEEISLADAFNGDEEAYNAFKTRLYDIGLTVYETEQYFKDQKKAADEAIDSIETYDAIKQIQKLTGGVNDLKNAFNELHEEGIISADTLLGLEENFGDVDGWKEFFEVVSSGTATMEEAQDAAKILAENYIDKILSSGALSQKEYITAISHLQSLGITNAKDFLDAKLKKNMATDIAQRVKNGTSESDAIKAVEEEYGIKLDGESDRLLIEKAITAEKAKQDALDKQAAKNEYDTAKNNYEIAIEKNRYIDDQIQDFRDLTSGEFSDYFVGLEDYGVTHEVGNMYWYMWYNGEKYTDIDKLKAAIEADLQSQKVEVPSLPAEVTEIDVTNANNAATEATNALQAELDNHNLVLNINLIDPSELVDEAQNIYDTLANAAKEYGESGYVSVDTLQSLLQLEPKYLALLYDENGQLNLNKDTMYQLTVARVTDMGIQQAQQVIETARTALLDGNIEKLKELTTATYGQATSNWDLVKSNLALLKTEMKDKGVDDSIYQGIEDQVFAIQNLTNTTIANIGNTISSSGNTATAEVDDAFQDAMDYWENRIGAAESRFEQIQNEIDLLESQGKKAGAGYYQEQIKQLQEFDSAGNLVGGKLYLLNQQLAEAQAMLSDPNIKEGSEEWWEIANTINSIEGEIDDVILSIQDLKDAMADTHWYIFDEAHDRASTLTSDLENIRNILSNEKLFDDEGNFTEEGLGTLATYVQELGVFEGALANAKAEMELFGDSYDPNKKYVDLQGNDLSIDSEQDWYDAAEKAEEKYDEWNNKVIKTRYNIKYLYEQQIDAVEEYTQTLVENYNEYIDAVKEALDSERDLYEFKKSTEQKSKNMAALERRIASLSGSTNASDVAERRKLQAELMDAKSDMDDHYYSHSKEQQSQALDNEMTAYETAMNTYIEGLRTKLEESTAQLYLSYEEMGTETKSFIDGVIQGIVLNSGTILEVYKSTGETINTALTDPFVKAAEKIGWFASSDEALGMMNSWTKDQEGSMFYDFKTKAEKYLEAPWTSITGEGGAVQTFQTSLTNTMTGIVDGIKTNVSNIITHIQTEIDKIKDTEIRIKVKKETENSSGDNGNLSLTGGFGGGGRVGFAEIMMYAKGTTGTTRDQLAITDESWIGEEITLAAGKNGQLQYLKKGSAVMPADISANLVEWGKINPSMLNAGVAPNINMISNAINKPELNISFESLIKAENITEETLPAVKKLVTQELNRFTRELNYSLKAKGAR